MKKIIVSLAILTAGFISQADNTTPNAQAIATLQAANQQVVPQIVPNLEGIDPSPVDVNNQAEIQALNDPSLPPMARNTDAGQLSGSAEANLINAGGASFENIDQQVNTDISSSNSAINSGNSSISDASKISNELGQNDINALSVPNNDEAVSSSQPN